MRSYSILVLATLLAAGSAQAADLALPASLQGAAEILVPTDPDYAQAGIGQAIQPAGKGGISQGLVVRITKDIPVYRLWSGPDKVNAQGYTNRIGSWWSSDAPSGTRAAYRRDYEVCKSWNDLTWVATCTLTAGTVVAVGPGQSVSAETCGDSSGQESYPANATHWQTYVANAWNRTSQLVCPAQGQDYADDPANIAKPLPTAKQN